MRIIFSFVLTALSLAALSQSRSTKDWIDFGSSHVNKWLQIAPGKMGPNALPVPDMDYGLIDTLSNAELGVHTHFMPGDHAVNSFMAFYWCVVPEKVAVKIWGFPTETFRMDNAVRDERQIYWDDTGWITNPGDLWISTFIQLVKEKKRFPDLTLNYSFKTTSGWAHHARYTEAGANYFYGALGKSVNLENHFIDEIRVALMSGFYVWQTNKVELAQDEGPLYQLGVQLKHRDWMWVNEIGGYSGYDAYDFIGVKGDNDPLIFRTRLQRTGQRFGWKAEYQAGFHDYHYKTFRASMIYRFGLEKKEND